MNLLWLAFEVPRWGRGLSFGLTLRIHRLPPTAYHPWFMVHAFMRSMNVLWLAFGVPQRGRGWYCRLICCHSLENLRVALRAAVWRDGPERRCRETVWRGRDPLQDRVASPISRPALGYHIKTVSFFGPWAPRTRIRSISPVRLGPVTREIMEGQWVPWSCSIRWKASVRSPSN
jgi:hypothetical protein